MSDKIIRIFAIIFLITFSFGCSSSDGSPTAKEALEDWRNQDFKESEPKNTSNNYQSETPSGSIECPIQIVDYHQQIDGSRLYIEGNVYNYGDSSYKNPQINCVKLYVFFYNKNGDVIAEDYYYLQVGTLGYGGKYHFNVSTNIRPGTERYLVKVRCCNK